MKFDMFNLVEIALLALIYVLCTVGFGIAVYPYRGKRSHHRWKWGVGLMLSGLLMALVFLLVVMFW